MGLVRLVYRLFVLYTFWVIAADARMLETWCILSPDCVLQRCEGSREIRVCARSIRCRVFGIIIFIIRRGENHACVAVRTSQAIVLGMNFFKSLKASSFRLCSERINLASLGYEAPETPFRERRFRGPLGPFSGPPRETRCKQSRNRSLW